MRAEPPSGQTLTSQPLLCFGNVRTNNAQQRPSEEEEKKRV